MRTMRFLAGLALAALLMIPAPAQAIDIGQSLKAVQSAGDFSKQLEGYYNQLMGFKGDAEFHEQGFDGGGEYADWKSGVQGLGQEEAQTPLQKGATDNLLDLGNAYKDSKGEETDLTSRLTKALQSFF